MSQSHITGLIIAAGKGERLRHVAPLKPLARVDGRPLIDWVLAGFECARIARIVVVTGYGAARLERHLRNFESGSGLAIEVVRNPDFSRANGCSVLCARDLIQGRFILSMSDHLFDPEIVRRLVGEGDATGLTLAVDRRLDHANIDIDDVTKVRTVDDRIVKIGKDLTDYNAFDTGLFSASSSLFEALEEEVVAYGDASLSAGVMRLARAGTASVLDIGERFWIDVDDEAACQRAEHAIHTLKQHGSLWV